MNVRTKTAWYIFVLTWNKICQLFCLNYFFITRILARRCEITLNSWRGIRFTHVQYVYLHFGSSWRARRAVTIAVKVIIFLLGKSSFMIFWYHKFCTKKLNFQIRLPTRKLKLLAVYRVYLYTNTYLYIISPPSYHFKLVSSQNQFVRRNTILNLQLWKFLKFKSYTFGRQTERVVSCVVGILKNVGT